MISPPSLFFLFPGTGDEEEEGLHSYQHHPSSLPPSRLFQVSFSSSAGKSLCFYPSLSLSLYFCEVVGL